MKKAIIIGIMLLLSISLVSAITITKQEFMSASNQQIATYMQNNFELHGYNMDQDNLNVYYNLIAIEPNGENIDIKTIRYKTSMRIPYIKYCLQSYSASVCVNNLINGEYEFEYLINGENHTILPTYLQAYNEAYWYYNRAITLRDDLIEQNSIQSFISAMPSTSTTTTTMMNQTI